MERSLAGPAFGVSLGLVGAVALSGCPAGTGADADPEEGGDDCCADHEEQGEQDEGYDEYLADEDAEHGSGIHSRMVPGAGIAATGGTIGSRIGPVDDVADGAERLIGALTRWTSGGTCSSVAGRRVERTRRIPALGDPRHSEE